MPVSLERQVNLVEQSDTNCFSLQNVFSLCELKKNEKAVVVGIEESFLGHENVLPSGELERRLLEMGFVEGTEVCLQHEGPIQKDPIVILLRACTLIALRRKEAKVILVRRLV